MIIQKIKKYFNLLITHFHTTYLKYEKKEVFKISRSKEKSAILLVATIIIIFITLYIGYFGLFLLLLSDIKTPAVMFIEILYFEIILLALLKLWGKKISKNVKKIFITVGSCSILIIASTLGYSSYLNSIPMMDDKELNLGKYQPFIDTSKVATLSGKSALRLTDDLPRLDSATELYPVMSAFVQAIYPKNVYFVYGDSNEDVVHMSDTIDAYQNLIDKKTDIIFVDAPSKDQISLAKSKGVNFKLTPIGKEAFVFFVNSKNPVDDLTVSQIQDIYSDNIKNWNKVGGKNLTIKAFQRPKDSGSQAALIKFMGDKTIMTPPIIDDESDFPNGLVEKVAVYKNFNSAIGYSFRFFATEMVKNNQIKLLKINGVYPSNGAIRDGSYPLSKEFYAVTRDKVSPNTQKIIEWILSDEGQELIEKTGYISVK